MTGSRLTARLRFVRRGDDRGSMIPLVLGFFVLAIQTGEKDLGMGIIARHFHAGDGHQTHTRIVDSKPHQFGNVVSVDEVAGTRINQAQIGSCANGRYEDIEIAARMLKGRKVAKGVRFLISPASQQVYLQCLKAGLIEQLVESGAQVITPGCGICQPKVGFLSDGEVCITATTRNFKGRKGSQKADIYLGGPLTVTAAAVAGQLANPRQVFDEL